jgi:hypothetical protein
MFCDIMDVPVRTAGTAIMWKPAGCLCHTCALPSAKLPSFLLSFLPSFLSSFNFIQLFYSLLRGLPDRQEQFWRLASL